MKGIPLVFQEGDVDGAASRPGAASCDELARLPTALLALDDGRGGFPFMGDPRRALAAVCARFAALG